MVRHAHAGDREAWEGPDERRPLTKRGRRQAAGLVALLADTAVDRILSSHYVRCLETVVPLAGDRRRSIELHPALAEGASTIEARALVTEVAATDITVVLCTHGDVVWNLVAELARHGGGLPMEKGSTWIVEVRGGQLRPVRYLDPP